MAGNRGARAFKVLSGAIAPCVSGLWDIVLPGLALGELPVVEGEPGESTQVASA